MKFRISIQRGTLAVAAVIASSVISAQAASAPTLNARVVSRPFGPTERTTYSLPASTETSGGLSAIGVGTAAYLEAQVNLAVAATNVLSVTWSLSPPLGSRAALTNSPLGTNVLVYAPIDRLAYQVVGSRTLLRPDVEGQYVVTATITTATFGTTNVTATITAGTFLGWSQGCIACHSGGLGTAPNMSSWTNTLHASMFTRSIDGQMGYSKNCLSCHTVGYDNNPLAINGGFDDVMAATGWQFPTVITNGNWANIQANYPALANVANIQCENCHGPGSKHIIYNGVLGNTNTIAVSWDAGNCGQCHDAATHHIKLPEWNNSMHAVTVNESGPGRESCVICHSGIGYTQRGAAVTNTAFAPITCAACHDPHDASKPHQLRNVGPVLLADGTSVAGYETGELCMNCHHARTSATNVVATFARTGGRFGPHHSPQTDLFMGANGYTYGKNIPSSAHRDSIGDACVTCHMQPTAAKDPTFLLAGGHTWNMSCSNGGTNYDMTAACAQCHGQIDSFDMLREDFDGDGVVEGVQTEVQQLMDKLSTLLPPNTSVKSSLSVTTNWTQSQLAAAWNWSLVSEDRSHGVHNVAYAVGLLKASITDLTGDPAGLGPKTADDLAFYAWQVKYFGSATNPNAAPDATPANDGIPNWLKYQSGLNPLVPGTPGVDGGMVWAGNSAIGGNTATNTIQIYTAAEVTFNTQAGTTYQVQAASSMSSGWQNVSTNIPGTGTAVSFLTPTRQNVQQFFRVVHTP